MYRNISCKIAVFSSIILSFALVCCETTDTEKPQVVIHYPSDGEVVSGKIEIIAEVHDNEEVDEVQFFVDGEEQLHAGTANPYSCSLNTLELSAGTHTILVMAYDAAGNDGSDFVKFDVTKGTIDDTNEDTNVPPGAEIIPGVKAAEIILGDRLQKVKELYGEPDYEIDESGHFSYREIGLSGFFEGILGVNAYVRNLFVRSPYKAKTAGGNGIGSTRSSVEKEFGLPEEDGDWYWSKGIEFDYDYRDLVDSIFIFSPIGNALAPEKGMSSNAQVLAKSELKSMLRIHLLRKRQYKEK